MSLATIKTEIASIVSAVSGVSNVYKRDRWTVNTEQFNAAFKTASGKLMGWMITRMKTEEIDDTSTGNQAKHWIRIRGVYAISDADDSETTFEALVEAVRDALRAKFGLNGKATHTSPPSAAVVDARKFGGVTCHHAEIYMTATEIVAWSK